MKTIKFKFSLPQFSETYVSLEQQSPTFWYQGLVSWKKIFTQTGVGEIAGLCGDGSGGNESNRERANEALLAHLLL